MMRYTSTSLLLFFLLIANANSALGNNDFTHSPFYPNDSLLNKITNIDQRVKGYTVKDTLGGFSSPRKIETSNYINTSKPENQALRDREGLIVVPLDYQPFLSYINFVDTVIVAPEMLPIVFEGKILPSKLNFMSPDPRTNQMTPILINRDSIISAELYQHKSDLKAGYKLINKDSTFVNDLWKASRATSIRKEYYTNYPQRVKLNALAFNGSPIIKQEVENKNPFKELVTAGDAIEIARPDIEKYKIKQIFWQKWGEHNIKVSQKSYSQNWSPKTTNNFHLENYQKFTAKYSKDKITFEHWIEWRLNMQYTDLPKIKIDETGKTPEEIDAERKKEKKKYEDYSKVIINDDWIRTYNKLGLKSFIKRWSYIISADLKTPLFTKTTQTNKKEKLAAIFSPLQIKFGIGTSYELEWESTTNKKRKFKLSVDATPLSYMIDHVGSNEVWKKNKYGVVYKDKKDDEDKPKGEKRSDKRRYTRGEIGSSFKPTLTYFINNQLDFNTSIDYFTNYKRVALENQTTVNFQLNRYFATSLYVSIRFDDSAYDKKDSERWGYFSFNEVLGFGLSYRW